MKKKRRYFSVVAVILLLTNNTSGAAQVIAEEVSKNNNIEKIGNEKEKEKEDTKQDSDTINSSEKQNIEEKDKNLSKNGNDTEEVIQTVPKQFLPEFSATVEKDYSSKTDWTSWGEALVMYDSSSGEVYIGGAQDVPGQLINVGSTDEAPWRNGEIDPSEVTSITFESFIVLPQDSSKLFSGLSNLREVNFNSLNTANVTNMTNMFYGASSLTNLDLSGFDTSNVMEMYGMFDGASSLTNLDLSGFDTSKVTSLYAMFYGTSSLTNLDLSSFDTSNVTNMTNMFYGASSLTNLDLSSFDTSKVTDMSSMFNEASSLRDIDLSSFDTSNVLGMTNMFINLPKLQKLTLGDSFEFKGDAALGSPAGLDGAENLTGNWIREDGKFKGYSPADFMANYGKNDELTAGTYVAETEQLMWGTSPWSFDEETGTLTVEAGQISDNNANGNQAPWNRTDEDKIRKDDVKKIEFTGKVVAPEDSSSLFLLLSNLREFSGISNLDTSKVTNMRGMFKKASSLTNLDLSSFDTSSVTTMTAMFREASSLTNLDLSSFDTSKANYMQWMFEGASSLTNLDLSSFDTSNVRDMGYMFTNLPKLQKLTLGDSFEFKLGAALESPAGLDGVENLTGNWIREDGKFKGYSPADFMANYGKNDELTAGTYVAETEPLKWGTSPWSFDEETGTLIVESGELIPAGSVKNPAPWNRGDSDRIAQDKIKKIEFTGKVIAPKDSAWLFSTLSNLREFSGISNFDTSNVTDMSFMFRGGKSLMNLDLSSFDLSNVTSMFGMFEGVSSLTNLDLSSFDTSSVTTMTAMFREASSLRDLDLSGFDTSNVTDMSYMFEGASSFTNLDLSGFDTSNVTNMYRMFNGASSLTNLDLSSFDTSNVTNMTEMFWDASSLTNLDLSSFDTSNVINMYGMFKKASSLTNLDLSSFDTSSVKSMTAMFREASSLTNLDLSSFDTSNVTNMTNMFTNLPKLQKLTLGDSFEFKDDAALGSPAGLDGVEDLTGNWIREDGKSKGYSPADFMANYGKNDELTAGTYVAETEQLMWGTSPWSFDEETGTLNVEAGELAEYNAEENLAPWKRDDNDRIAQDKIKKIEFTGKVIAPSNSSSLFSPLSNLREFSGISNLDTSKVTNMDLMFYGASSLRDLDLSGFDTSNVTGMTLMFSHDTSLTNLDLSNFDTSKVMNMSSMFYGASSLRDIDLSGFDTSKLKYMTTMFANLPKLQKLTLGDSFEFKDDAALGSPAGLDGVEDLTGKWIREDGKSKGYSPVDFMANYGKNNELTAGVYVAQLSHFGFKEVPEKMSFKETKISNRTTLTQRQDPQWKMTVEDTRPTSSNWHVTAKMEENFKDSKGNPVDSDLLLFRKNGQADQWINSKSETIVYEGKGNPVKDDHDISWDEKEGPLIQVAPGAVKADEYKGDITWNLVDAPL
ncbi:BspA family leucine-rich repeat surface protein [Lactococcus garvieae]|uniref:BspA family leucine-rich repeat surface protein n=1 Tax=Lactococcus garvieae TaxID=1363 RepID=UPI00254D94C2|nr:BspA family leucine-rich repeat surface protein [Lactococcus garvieae]